MVRAMASLPITIVSDLVCPWCFIGTRRLDLALDSLPEIQASIRYRPFLLDLGAPPEGTDLRASLRRKFGDPEPMFRRVEAAARESGIPLDFAKVQRAPSTLAAHTLLRHAEARGTQRALAKALFAAYFLEGEDIGDPAVLARHGSSHGFSEAEALGLVRDEAGRQITRVEAQKAAAEGVSGVPFFILGGRHGLSGAQPVETFRQALTKAASLGAS
jgi:predicted DsbA family dithiol-disulfide isomerase